IVGVNVASWLGAMFQYHGTAKNAPLRLELPKFGNKTPLCRALLSGKEIQGRYRIGTPSKSTVALWPTPRPAAVSSVSSRARICQSDRGGGQLLSVTWRKVIALLGLIEI